MYSWMLAVAIVGILSDPARGAALVAATVTVLSTSYPDAVQEVNP